MSKLYDLAHAYALKNPTRSANPDGTGAKTSWNGWCQSLVWRFTDKFGKGATPPPVNAITAAHRSKIISKDWTKAPVGAFHYWDIGRDGHVGIDLKGGGSWVFMASRKITTVWGDAIGCASVTQYNQKSGAKYLGYALTNANGDLAKAIAPTPKPKPKPKAS